MAEHDDHLTTTPGPAHVPAEACPPSAAVERFKVCRWRRPAASGVPEGCDHRDVLPLTGAHGFDPQAWCTDCQFFKVRRVPKKRPATDYSWPF